MRTDDEEVVYTTFLPRWLMSRSPVRRSDWLREVDAAGLRVEVRRFAEAVTASGFHAETGSQVHPKALSVLAHEAGCSVAAVKRHKRRLLDEGLWEELSWVVLIPGKRATPLMQLTRPHTSQTVPPAAHEAFADLADLFPENAPWPSALWVEAKAA